MNIPIDWAIAGPATIVAAGAVIALLVDAFFPRRTWLGSGLPSTAALIVAGIELFRLQDDIASGTFALSLIVLAGTLFVVLASNVMNFENAMPPGEYHFLMLSAAAGALLMVSARDLVTLLVALELLSLPSIALVGLRQGDRRAIRASWTFFLASVVSTAITLMGISLLYGITGSLEYNDVYAGRLIADTVPVQVETVAILLTLIGFLFKLGAVPFHMWIPDAYLGAPVLVAGFLSTVSKAASLGALMTLLTLALSFEHDPWLLILAGVAAVTMTIGNIGALRQTNAVGMLAWSSVAQAGFVLAPVFAFSPFGWPAAIQYLAAYVLANLVAFAALAIVLRLRGSTDYDELRGLARTDPPTGIPLALAALTLAGFPPAIIGLVTKYVVIEPVIEGGETWLAVVMAINVMLGLAYYLRFVAVLFDKPEGETYVSPSPPFSVRVAKTVVILGALGIVVLSAWPDLLLSNLP